MKIKRLVLFVITVLSAVVQADTAWFGVTFGDYQLGEALSAKGASGGAWEPWETETTVTNVAPGVMRLDADNAYPSVTFAANPAAGENVWQFDFRVKPDSTMAFGEAIDGGCCSVTFVDGETNAVDFAAVIDGRWVRLAAPGFAPSLDVWYDLRVEIRRIDGNYVAGCFARLDGAWRQLVSSLGTSWFDVSAETAEAVSRVVISGRGEFSDFAGVKDTSTDETVALHWIGGDEGTWTGTENWSATAGGASAGRAPAEGDLVKIAGKVKLTLGDETGTVSNLLARVGAGGRIEFVSGEVLPDATLDISRPSVGTPLAVTAATFNGARPAVEARWYRAGTDRRTFALADVTTSYVPTAADYEHWLRCVVTDTAGAALMTNEFFFSKLPVFYLTTDDGQTPSPKKEKHSGKVFVQGNADWPKQYGDSIAKGGKMEISVRGNSTATQPKKPWKLKLKDKSKMFDIPKSKSWVLLANYLDESSLRNKLAYDFANEIGSLGMKSVWVECILNGEWQGLYQFGEQIKIDKNRVNVFDWESAGEDAADALAEKLGLDDDATSGLEDLMVSNLNWIATGRVTFDGTTYALGDYIDDFTSVTNDLTGGYLFEYDWSYDEVSKFKITAGNLRLDTMFKSPEYANTCQAMFDWSQTFIREYANAITSIDGYSPQGRHYSQICDIESMVSYFLVMELFGNDDARYKSIYSYKDRKNKKGVEQLMKYGPVWDFDWGVGNYQVPYNPEKWIVNHSVNSMYKEWADDPWFCTLLWTRYPAARAKMAEIVRDGGLIDQYYAFLHEAGVANEAKWTHHYGFTGGIYGTGSHPGLKAYLKKRLAWLDLQFADVPTLMESLKNATSYVVDAGHDGGNPAQTHPYTRQTATLPISFANAPEEILREGQSLRMSFRVSGNLPRLGVYANGLKVAAQPLEITEGLVDVVIPYEMLSAARGDPNCISLIGYDAGGTVVARNYALVTIGDWDDARDATEPTVDGTDDVPAVPYRWIRDAAAAVRPSLAWATDAEFASVILEKPSPWGKATPLWQDYVAGTNPDPNGTNSTLRITSIVETNGVWYLDWTPNLHEQRRYTIGGKVRLDDPNENEWQYPAPAGARFFRVKVTLP